MTNKNTWHFADDIPNFNPDSLYARAKTLVQNHISSNPAILAKSLGEGFASDQALADELELWATNDRNFYTKWATPIIKNLIKHLKRGAFDKKQSLKSWERAANAAADLYAKEFGGAGAKGKDMFPPKIRKLTAVGFAEYYDEEIQDGAES